MILKNMQPTLVSAGGIVFFMMLKITNMLTWVSSVYAVIFAQILVNVVSVTKDSDHL